MLSGNLSTPGAYGGYPRNSNGTSTSSYASTPGPYSRRSANSPPYPRNTSPLSSPIPPRTFPPRGNSPYMQRQYDPVSHRATIANKIVADCYAKFTTSPTGIRILESTYLTHVLVKEFTDFPAQPPQLGPITGSVKDRFISLCEKFDGHIVMHKGKVNTAKNVYQIGREWNLADLTAITRVGANGLIMSFNKDYFWQVNEDSDRVLKFARHLTVNHARVKAQYPALYGFSVSEFELPHNPRQTMMENPLMAAIAARQQQQQQQQPPQRSISTDYHVRSLTPTSHDGVPPRHKPSTSPAKIYKHSLHPSETISLKNFRSRNSAESRNGSPDTSRTSLDTATTTTQPIIPPEPLKPPVVKTRRKSSDFGIVEIEDDSDSDLSARRRQLNSSGSLLDRSLPLNDKDDIQRTLKKKPTNASLDTVALRNPQKPPFRLPHIPLNSTDSLDSSTSTMKSWDGTTDSGGSMRKNKTTTTSNLRPEIAVPLTPPSLDSLERDAEVEEILDEVQWTNNDDSALIIRKLTRELSNTKHKRVEQLVSLDFDGKDASQIVTRALRESDNLMRVFATMRIDLGFIAPDIIAIECDSGGLQLKKSNKQFLYDVLHQVLSRVDISAADLQRISSFSRFEDWDALEQVEQVLVSLYRALDTTRHASANADEDLSSMKALQQYESTYHQVGQQLVHRFLGFMEKSLHVCFQRLRADLQFQPISLAHDLNRFVIYGGLALFVQFFGKAEFARLNEIFNLELAQFLGNFFDEKLSELEQEFPAIGPLAATSNRNSSSSSMITPKRVRTKLGRKSSSKMGGLRASEYSEHSMHGGRVESREAQQILLLFSATELLIDIVENFIGTAFYHTNGTLDFSEYVARWPFEKRRRVSQTPDETVLDTAKTLRTNDSLSNLVSIFGSSLQAMFKRINPQPPSLCSILIMLEIELAHVHSTRGKQVFVSENFLVVARDKVSGMWQRHVTDLESALKRAGFTAKPGILPLVRNVCHFFVHTELVAQRMSQAEFPETRALIDKAYVLLSDELVSISTRVDPLLKTSSYDDKQKEHRNIYILQNVYFVVKEVSIFPQHAPVRRRLEPVLGKVRGAYFATQFRKHFAKLQDFFDSYNAVNPQLRGKKYNKKFFRSFLVAYTTRDIEAHAYEMYHKLEKHFLQGQETYERELLDTLWLKLELEFVAAFTRLTDIVRTTCDDSDVDYHVLKQDIRQIFSAIHSC